MLQRMLQRMLAKRAIPANLDCRGTTDCKSFTADIIDSLMEALHYLDLPPLLTLLGKTPFEVPGYIKWQAEVVAKDAVSQTLALLQHLAPRTAALSRDLVQRRGMQREAVAPAVEQGRSQSCAAAGGGGGVGHAVRCGSTLTGPG